MARTTLSFTEIEDLAKQVVKTDVSSLQEYQDNAGWEKWMDDFTDAGDGEECSEGEINIIRKEQARIWDKVLELREQI